MCVHYTSQWFLVNLQNCTIITYNFRILITHKIKCTTSNHSPPIKRHLPNLYLNLVLHFKHTYSTVWIPTRQSNLTCIKWLTPDLSLKHTLLTIFTTQIETLPIQLLRLKMLYFLTHPIFSWPNLQKIYP